MNITCLLPVCWYISSAFWAALKRFLWNFSQIDGIFAPKVRIFIGLSHPISSAKAVAKVVFPFPFGPKNNTAFGTMAFCPLFSFSICEIKYFFKIFFPCHNPLFYQNLYHSDKMNFYMKQVFLAPWFWQLPLLQPVFQYLVPLLHFALQ